MVCVRVMNCNKNKVICGFWTRWWMLFISALKKKFNALRIISAGQILGSNFVLIFYSSYHPVIITTQNCFLLYRRTHKVHVQCFETSNNTSLIWCVSCCHWSKKMTTRGNHQRRITTMKGNKQTKKKHTWPLHLFFGTSSKRKKISRSTNGIFLSSLYFFLFHSKLVSSESFLFWIFCVPCNVSPLLLLLRCIIIMAQLSHPNPCPLLHERCCVAVYIFPLSQQTTSTTTIFDL